MKIFSISVIYIYEKNDICTNPLNGNDVYLLQLNMWQETICIKDSCWQNEINLTEQSKWLPWNTTLCNHFVILSVFRLKKDDIGTWRGLSTLLVEVFAICPIIPQIPSYCKNVKMCHVERFRKKCNAKILHIYEVAFANFF